MKRNFDNLIEKFGVPKIVITNKAEIIYNNGGNFPVRLPNPEIEIDPQNRVYYRSFKHGNSEFLTVKSRIETDLSNENLLLEDLKKQGLNPIAFCYTSKQIWTLHYSQNPEFSWKVEITTDADIQPLSRADLSKAVEEQRLLRVYSWNSMGDSYLHYHICETIGLPEDDGIYFLFQKPLSGEMLAGLADDYERGDDIMDFCSRHYFYRQYLADK